MSTHYRFALLLLPNGFSLAWTIANLLPHSGPFHVRSVFSVGMCACGTYVWPWFCTACMHYPTLRQKPVMRNPGITDCYPYTVLQQMYISWSAPGHWVNINPIAVQGKVYGDAITDTEPSLCSASALEASGDQQYPAIFAATSLILLVWNTWHNITTNLICELFCWDIYCFWKPLKM